MHNIQPSATSVPVYRTLYVYCFTTDTRLSNVTNAGSRTGRDLLLSKLFYIAKIRDAAMCYLTLAFVTDA